MIDFILEIHLEKEIISLADLFIKKPVFSQSVSNDRFEFIAWGDLIIDKDFYKNVDGAPDAKFIVTHASGHYFYAVMDKQKKSVAVGNSLFSILPIYFWQGQDRLLFSANASDLGEYIGEKSLSRRFILETMLFNYPLFNESIIEGVNLLPSNSAMMISSGKCKIEKHTHIEDYFNAKPLSWRKTVDEMSDAFLQVVENYLPEQFYAYSLTGGFDGRTLTSAGLYYKKNFACYSFGSSGSRDIEIASALSESAGIPLIKVDLDDRYVKNSSLECGLEFIRNASGTATFARAHYLHAAKLLAEKTECIITGNFGSEIFRAAHVPGIVISPNLYHLFAAANIKDAIHNIEVSDEFDYLNTNSFKREWAELKDDLSLLPCFSAEHRSLSKNRQFYIFLFEEIFRKYFGAEMVNQFRFLRNRTPFLDWDFLKALMRTGLAGIHSDFFEHNPVKRFKGQVLYAQIIRKAYPAFGRMMTDKGYRPDDLLTVSGKLAIVRGYAKKLISKRKGADSDPYAVSAAFQTNRPRFARIRLDPEWFNGDRIKRELDENKPDEALFKPLSLSYMKELAES